MSKTNIDKMDAAELEAELQRVNAERDRLKERARELTRALDRQLTAERAAVKVAAMSDAERAAMRDVIVNAEPAGSSARVSAAE